MPIEKKQKPKLKTRITAKKAQRLEDRCIEIETRKREEAAKEAANKRKLTEAQQIATGNATKPTAIGTRQHMSGAMVKTSASERRTTRRKNVCAKADGVGTTWSKVIQETISTRGRSTKSHKLGPAPPSAERPKTKGTPAHAAVEAINDDEDPVVPAARGRSRPAVASGGRVARFTARALDAEAGSEEEPRPTAGHKRKARAGSDLDGDDEGPTAAKRKAPKRRQAEQAGSAQRADEQKILPTIEGANNGNFVVSTQSVARSCAYAGTARRSNSRKPVAKALQRSTFDEVAQVAPRGTKNRRSIIDSPDDDTSEAPERPGPFSTAPTQRLHDLVCGIGRKGGLGISIGRGKVNVPLAYATTSRRNQALEAAEGGIVQVAAGAEHAVALTGKGRVLT